jgi:hypothetical protein
VIGLLAVPLMAVANQIRGGGAFFHLGRLTEKLPGRPGWWMVPLVAVAGAFCLPWSWACYWAFCWLIWSILPWGRWYRPHLGIVPHADGKISGFEHLVERICGGQADLCFLFRNTLSCLPLIVLSPWLVLLAPVQGLLYRVIQQAMHGEIDHCELATGAAWGLALWSLS